MRHRIKGKKLNRSVSHRKAMYRNMVSSLVQEGAIRTTLPKAKAIQPLVERMVTKAKSGDLSARRKMLAFFYQKQVAEKMLNEVAPLFVKRPGGYTRIVKLGPRSTDNTEMARIEFVEKLPSSVAEKPKEKAKKKVTGGQDKKDSKSKLENQKADEAEDRKIKEHKTEGSKSSTMSKKTIKTKEKWRRNAK